MCYGSPRKTWSSAFPWGQVRLSGQRLQFLEKEKETLKEHTVLMKRLSGVPSWW